jgi:hypothetical protein
LNGHSILSGEDSNYELFMCGAVRTDDEIGVAGLPKRGIIYVQKSNRQMFNRICEWLNGSPEKVFGIFSVYVYL